MRYIFDLKGSLVDRKVKGKTKPSTTLKDINFIMSCKSNPNLTSFTPRDQKKLRATVCKDVAFLQSEGLMDYSLLLAIETLQKKPEEPGLIHKTQDDIARYSIQEKEDDTNDIVDVGELMS